MTSNGTEIAKESNLQTIAGIILGFVLVIPCGYLSGFAVTLYKIFDAIGGQLYEISIFPFLSGIAIFVFRVVFPAIIQGGMTAFLTIVIDYKIFKKAKKDAVLIGVLCGWIPILLMVLFYRFANYGIDMEWISMMLSYFTFVLAAISTHASLTAAALRGDAVTPERT